MVIYINSQNFVVHDCFRVMVLKSIKARFWMPVLKVWTRALTRPNKGSLTQIWELLL